ncbi:MAG: hypothetical protein QE271_14700 [Bacteriovoracaceae bacterium]|nr:hypothetical protein [Bacteriovoracaceae bacterium]
MSDNTLTLFVIPSPYPINWTSPRDLLASISKNYFSFQPNFMGHVQVGVSCQNSMGKKVEFFTGMVAKSLTAKTELILHGAGLGVLFHSFEGRVEFQGEEAKEDFEKLKEFLSNPESNQGLNFISFKINSAQCDRVSEYHDTYLKFNLGKYYGLPNDPRKGEGSGCSAFGASFLDALNLLTDEMKSAWSGVRFVPKKYAGPPVNESYVNVLSLLWDNPAWGSSEDENHLKIFFYEPGLMYQWIENQIKNFREGNKNSSYQVVKLYERKGILIPYSDKNSAPSTPLYTAGHLPWVKDFDKNNQSFYQWIQKPFLSSETQAK